MAQSPRIGGAAHRTKPCAVFRRELGHVVTSFAYYFNIVVYHTGSSAGKFDFTPFAGNRNKSCIHASNRL